MASLGFFVASSTDGRWMTDRERVVLSLNAECCWMLTSQDLCLDGRHPGENVLGIAPSAGHQSQSGFATTYESVHWAQMCPEVPVEHVSVWPQ